MRLIFLGCFAALLFSSSFTYALDSNISEKASQNNHLILANAPPGLEKKGMTTIPSFLGNTPPGWDEGLKKGWNKNRDWRWDHKTKLWENKHWQWNTTTNQWQKTKGWGKGKGH
jgi:hypothetical protein